MPTAVWVFSRNKNNNNSNIYTANTTTTTATKKNVLSWSICSSSPIIFTNNSKSCYFPCNFTLADQQDKHKHTAPLRVSALQIKFITSHSLIHRMFTEQQSVSLSLITLFNQCKKRKFKMRFSKRMSIHIWIHMIRTEEEERKNSS